MPPTTDVDAYLAALPDEARDIVLRVLHAVREALPGAPGRPRIPAARADRAWASSRRSSPSRRRRSPTWPNSPRGRAGLREGRRDHAPDLLLDAGRTIKGVVQALGGGADHKAQRRLERRVRETLRILTLPEAVQAQVADGTVPARALKTLGDLAPIHPELADQIGMSPWTGQKWASLAAPDYARYVARRHTQDSSAPGAFGRLLPPTPLGAVIHCRGREFD